MLQVFPNPFAHLDADGHPCAIVIHPETRRPIGAYRDPKEGHRFQYELTESHPCPEIRSMKDALKEGALFAADEHTAAESGLKFTNPKALLESAKAEAALRYLAQTGNIAPFALPPSAPPTQPELPEEPKTEAPSKTRGKSNT